MNDEQPTGDTPGSTDPWESEMSREFDKRVRDLHEAPLTLEHVRGKAMTIRRNRRIAVASGIVAAAAVIVPVAVFAGDGLSRTDDRQDFTSESPSPTEAVDPGTLEVAYLEGRTWHRDDGTTVRLGARYDGGTRLDDDLLAVRNDEGRLIVDVIDADGDVTESFPVLSYPVADAGRTSVAYVDTDGALVTRSDDGSAVLATGFVDGDSVAAVADDRVYVTHGDTRPPEVVDADGTTGVVVPEVYKLNDVAADGRVAAQATSTDTGSCSGVYDGSGAELVETCDYTFDDFSPDGTHLSGADAYRDGVGQGYVVILDADTTREVARWEATGGMATSWVWEDAEHLLINAYEQGESRVYRLGVDGQVERVLSSPDGDEVDPAFLLLGGS